MALFCFITIYVGMVPVPISVASPDPFWSVKFCRIRIRNFSSWIRILPYYRGIFASVQYSTLSMYNYIILELLKNATSDGSKIRRQHQHQ
jgi:hypothetical protein